MDGTCGNSGSPSYGVRLFSCVKKSYPTTPYSINSLFIEFVKELSGVILMLRETICGSFGSHVKEISKGKLFNE